MSAEVVGEVRLTFPAVEGAVAYEVSVDPCPACGGVSRWNDDDGNPLSPCEQCSNTGVLRLTHAPNTATAEGA